MKPPKAVSEYMRQIGKKGGEADGKRKARGDSEYYRKLVAKRKRKSSER